MEMQDGIMDSGVDITIIAGEPFKKVAAVARLRKKNFKDTDKIPSNCDGQPFSLDGRKDLEATLMTQQSPRQCTSRWIFHTTQC